MTSFLYKNVQLLKALLVNYCPRTKSVISVLTIITVLQILLTN